MALTAKRRLILLCTAMAAAAPVAIAALPQTNTPFTMNLQSLPTTPLSVMTYNVEGLPWPLRIGRSAALASISERLRVMRVTGHQPHIVVLQEAFTADAKRIGHDSGYRYVVDGPGRDDKAAEKPTRENTAFAGGGSFFKGELSGRLLDSGLQILSDYPILAVRRAPFPAFACAGFDCLANKGMLMVLLAVPGSPTPVAIVTAHLNSHYAAHVRYRRSYYAYTHQVDALDQFLANNVAPGVPLIVAGDFNVGKAQDRRAYLLRHAASWWNGRDGARLGDAYHDCAARPIECGQYLDADAHYSFARARDWQFTLPGQNVGTQVQRIAVPFGHDGRSQMLSDHVGYIAYYQLTSRRNEQAIEDGHRQGVRACRYQSVVHGA